MPAVQKVHSMDLLRNENFLFIVYNGGNATATVTLPRGSESIAWKHQELKSLMQKDGAIDIAMRGIFNRDLATKVASSIPISN